MKEEEKLKIFREFSEKILKQESLPAEIMEAVNQEFWTLVKPEESKKGDKDGTDGQAT
jgi:hypothetical protein